jgi:hypothetical protein
LASQIRDKKSGRDSALSVAKLLLRQPTDGKLSAAVLTAESKTKVLLFTNRNGWR